MENKRGRQGRFLHAMHVFNLQERWPFAVPSRFSSHTCRLQFCVNSGAGLLAIQKIDCILRCLVARTDKAVPVASSQPTKGWQYKQNGHITKGNIMASNKTPDLTQHSPRSPRVRLGGF